MTDPEPDIDIAASYSRRDAAIVVPILDGLKARGIRVWFDKNIPGGALWEETITRNMRKAQAVLFFVSRESLDSDRCFDEVSAARTLRKPIIPAQVQKDLRIPDDLPDRLVLTLQTRNTVDAWPGADTDPVETLMHALASFGVRGAPRFDDPPPGPTPGISPPSPAPRLEPIRPAVPPASALARRRGPAILVAVAAVILIAVGLGTAFALGLLAPRQQAASDAPPADISSLDIHHTDAEWCSLGAPRLLGTAIAANGLPALKNAAQAGDLDAQTLHCLSANAACTSGGQNADFAGAYAACIAAAGKGRLRAEFNRGWLLQRGCGTRIDAEAAVASYTKSAAGGCAMAQFYLGTLYEDGDLVAADQAKAIQLLTAAADQDYPPALNRLGADYALGHGVANDDAKAADLFRRAGDLGDARGAFNYAKRLEQGLGVPKNAGGAIVYYRRAAQQNDDPDIKKQAEDALTRLGVNH